LGKAFALLDALVAALGRRSSSTPEQEFWVWFEKNSAELLVLEELHEPGISDELSN